MAHEAVGVDDVHRHAGYVHVLILEFGLYLGKDTFGEYPVDYLIELLAPLPLPVGSGRHPGVVVSGYEAVEAAEPVSLVEQG